MSKKTSIGGQAVIEGIMMKGPKKTALAVRLPDDTIDIEYIEEKHKKNIGVLEKINNYISYHVLLIVVNYCFNPENDLTIKEQIKMLENVCKVEEFKNAIQKSGYKGFSITRKIALFTLKHRLYILTMYIGKIRQNQFKHRRKK